MDEKILIRSQLYRISTKATIIFFAVLYTCVFLGCRAGFGVDVGESIPLQLVIDVVLFLLYILFMRIYFSCDIVVTDKRVYGRATFGKRVDLPLDSISAVGTSALWGIDVGTSSGRIHFKLIKNKDEIHSELSKLLMERQHSEKQNNIPLNNSTSNADELKKFKELLDSGVITQEEFDAKKKQLLGL